MICVLYEFYEFYTTLLVQDYLKQGKIHDILTPRSGLAYFFPAQLRERLLKSFS